MKKNNETDIELCAQAQEAAKVAKKMVARYAHVKEPAGMSLIVGPQTKKQYEHFLASMQKHKPKLHLLRNPKAKSIKTKKGK